MLFSLPNVLVPSAAVYTAFTSTQSGMSPEHVVTECSRQRLRPQHDITAYCHHSVAKSEWHAITAYVDAAYRHIILTSSRSGKRRQSSCHGITACHYGLLPSRRYTVTPTCHHGMPAQRFVTARYHVMYITARHHGLAVTACHRSISQHHVTTACHSNMPCHGHLPPQHGITATCYRNIPSRSAITARHYGP